MGKIIIFINAEDPEIMDIATDENSYRLLFDTSKKAEEWCLKNSEAVNSYMLRDGER